MMHDKCAYYTQCGSIFSRYNPGFMVDEDVTVLLDIGSGTLLKVGRKEDVEKYHNKMYTEYVQTGYFTMIRDLKLITFHVKYENLGFAPEGYNFDIDEVCTLINYLGNTIGAEKMNWLLGLSLDDLKTEIHRLQEIGF